MLSMWTYAELLTRRANCRKQLARTDLSRDSRLYNTRLLPAIEAEIAKRVALRSHADRMASAKAAIALYRR